ncbi:MAG: hypothetical protein RLZZ165_1145 [Bacteroidota bacterium]|jgi:hypothetical protein
MAEEMLHDRILRLAFLADVDRPAQLTTEDVFWRLEDAQLSLVQIKDCLEWLVRQGDMVLDRSKYSLGKAKFFELKRQFAHVGSRGISIWLAPIAPIHIPLPAPEIASVPVAFMAPPEAAPGELPVASVAHEPEPLAVPMVEESPPDSQESPPVAPMTISHEEVPPAAMEAVLHPPASTIRGLRILIGVQAALLVALIAVWLVRLSETPFSMVEALGLGLGSVLCAGQWILARTLRSGIQQTAMRRGES